MMKELYLDFYGVTAKVTGTEEVLQTLSLDFEYFQRETVKYVDFAFKLSYTQPDFSPVENLKATKQSFNSVTFDCARVRYNDYYSKGLTTYDYEHNYGLIESLDLNFLHEITYLMILSRVGKELDIRGFHKVHAMAVGYKDCALILMMPMKGGKSTLFVDLLKDKEISIISDDSPLIKNGNVYPFPLRVGVGSLERLPKGDRDLLYSIERNFYGKKTLAPLSYFKNSVGKSFNKVLICEGVRIYNDQAEIVKEDRLFGLKALCRHMVIGVGLPMIIEYFIENTLKDHFKNLFIFFKRFKSACILLSKSNVYEVRLGTDRDRNAEVINSFLRESQ